MCGVAALITFCSRCSRSCLRHAQPGGCLDLQRETYATEEQTIFWACTDAAQQCMLRAHQAMPHSPVLMVTMQHSHRPHQPPIPAGWSSCVTLQRMVGRSSCPGTWWTWFWKTGQAPRPLCRLLGRALTSWPSQQGEGEEGCCQMARSLSGPSTASWPPTLPGVALKLCHDFAVGPKQPINPQARCILT